MSEKNNTVTFVGGVLVGSLVGFVTTLILSSGKGKETKEILAKTADALPQMAEDITTTFQLNSEHVATIAKSQWHQNLSKVKKAIAIGIKASKEINNS